MTTAATCDSSVLVPALTEWHPEHTSARATMRQVTALTAHVVMECYSVLTRLPAPHRITPSDASDVLAALDLPVMALPAGRYRRLVSTMGTQGVRGGAAYDALVAATARHHGLVLLTRDRRARATYEALDVPFALV